MLPPPKKPRQPAPAKPPTHWGPVAQWYDDLVGDEGSEYQREVIWPGVLRMLDVKKGDAKRLAILDLACGQGAFCRKLAALGGGHTVTGIDAAPELLSAAKERQDLSSPVRYLLADITKLLTDSGALQVDLAPNSFDAATLILALQNLSPLSPLWKAAHTLLKPRGTLVIVMMHPAFRIPRQSDWHWDDKTHTQSRLIRQYLSSSTIPIQTHPGLAAHGEDQTTTPHFHRPLQAYINTLGNAGLLLDHVEEWPSHKKSAPGPRQKALDAARKEIPLFLALRARKV
jgi:SAM-dependent methyltransferase